MRAMTDEQEKLARDLHIIAYGDDLLVYRALRQHDYRAASLKEVIAYIKEHRVESGAPAPRPKDLALQIVSEEVDATLKEHRVGIDYQTFSHHALVDLGGRIKRRIQEECTEHQRR